MQNCLIVLGKDMKLYDFSNNKLDLIDFIIQSKGKVFDKFLDFVAKNWDFLEKQEQIYLILEPDSSFTDTRTIFIWLKSLEKFYQKDVFVVKLDNNIEIQNLASNLLNHLLTTAQKELIYSYEPKYF
jgi:hypothetical protein